MQDNAAGMTEKRFETWLEAHRGVLPGPGDVEGVWSRPGTRVLYPAGAGIGEPLADTPANVSRLRRQWEGERAVAEGEALAARLFGEGSGALAAFRGARETAAAFWTMARERLGALGAGDAVADLSGAWVQSALSAAGLPPGTAPGEEWLEAARAANPAALFRMASPVTGGTERWALAASLCPFEVSADGGLEARQATAGDLNALQECAEAALEAAGLTAPRPFFYLLDSRLGWSGATLKRLGGCGQPLVLVWSTPAGWNAALPVEGGLDAVSASLLDSLLPAGPEAMLGAVRGAVDEAFAAGEYALPLEEVRARAASRLPVLSGLPARFVREQVLALQRAEPERYWFVRGFGGQEEIRAQCKEMERITV